MILQLVARIQIAKTGPRLQPGARLRSRDSTGRPSSHWCLQTTGSTGASNPLHWGYHHLQTPAAEANPLEVNILLVHSITADLLRNHWIAENILDEVLNEVPNHYYTSSLQTRSVILIVRLPYGLSSLALKFPTPTPDGIWKFIYQDIVDCVADEFKRRDLSGCPLLVSQ